MATIDAPYADAAVSRSYRRPGSVLNIVTHFSLAIFVHLLNDVGLVSDKGAYFAFTLMVLTLGFFELQIERRKDPQRWLVSPAVLATFVTFFLSYGITNFLFLLPIFTEFTISENLEFHAPMTSSQFYTVLALGMMWLGYRLRLSGRIGRTFRACFPAPKGTQVGLTVLLVLFGVSVIARSYQLSIGVFGYTATAESLASNANITQYLAMAGDLGLLALALAMLQAYRQGATRTDTLLAMVMLAIEIGFGFLSGFKGAVISPVIVAALCRYISGKGISRRYFLVATLLLISAYAVIEPFRSQYSAAERSDAASFYQIATMLISEDRISTREPLTIVGVFQQVAMRLNLSNIGAYGIDYADDSRTHSPDDPNFLGNILMAPAMAFIPRAIWKSKPLADSGRWYTHEVLGRQINSSTAMGPVSFLYMAGGLTTILLGFLIIGMTQRALFVWFSPFASFGGAMVYLGIVGNIAFINSAVDSIFVTLIREVPMILILSHFIISRGNRA